MADDITLTVRVRDMTRGEFARLRQRMRGMDDDLRRTTASSGQASGQVERLSRSIRGTSERLQEMQRTGGAARSEMAHMSRTMGLLNRELRSAVRDGDMTEAQFNSLSRQLERTRLDFDHLSNDINRHSAEANRAAREEAAQQRANLARQMADGRVIDRQRRALLQAHGAALAEETRRVAAAQREQNAAQRAMAAAVMASRTQQRQVMLAHAAALREEERRSAAAARAVMADQRAQAAAVMASRAQQRRILLAHAAALREEERRNAAAARRSAANTQSHTGRMGGFWTKAIRLAIRLSPALIPLGAVAVSVASKVVASFGAAAAGLGAFGLALAPAAAGLMRIRESQKAYNEAVDLFGASSKKARSMQGAYNRVLGTLSPEVQKAAVGFGILSSQYKSWSSSLESATVPVMTRSFAVMGAMLPHLSGLVRGTSNELNRMVTILGGAIQTQGFSLVMQQFTNFANSVLVDATHGLLSFLRAMNSGEVGGKFSGFIAYVREVGPAVSSTLEDMGEAFSHMVEASSGVGVVILRVVAALSSLVSSIPSGVIENLLLLVFAFKMVGLAAGAMTKVGALIAAFKVQVAAAGAAAAGASGALGKLGAAFMALSRTAKIAVIGTVIGAAVVAAHELSQALKDPPTDMDKLGLAMMRLGQTGKVTGELTKLFGKDMKDLDDSVKALVRPSTVQQIGQFRDKLKFLSDSDTDKLNKSFKETDEILSDMVKSGNADLAAAAFKRMTKGMSPQAIKDLLTQIPKYDAAVQNLGLEQDLAAAAMGMFGAQAAEVQKKLEGQKASADGLRQSIIALNEVNMAASGAMNAFEAAIDAGAEAAGKVKGTVDLLANGMINMDSSGARDAETALRNLATSTHAAAAAAADQGAGWEEVQAIYARGDTQFRNTAQIMTGTAAEANILALAMLNIPNREVWIRMMKDQATAELNDFNAKVKASPGLKQIRVDVLSAMAQKVLTDLGYKVERMPDGSFTITAQDGQALGSIGGVEGRLNALDGKTATTRVINEIITKSITYKSVHDIVGATGGLFTGSSFKKRGMAAGGPVRGPGTGTSDDVFAPWLSNGEFVVNAKQAQKFLPLLEAINNGKMKLGALMAKGGKVKKSGGMSTDTRNARNDILGSMSISGLWKMTGQKRSKFTQNFGTPESASALIATINEWKDKIKKAMSGSAEKRMMKALSVSGAFLLKHQLKLQKVNAALDKAKDKLSDLKDKAAQLSESVKSGMIGSANITEGVEKGKGTSTGNILAKLQTDQRKAAEFASMLATLKARGLGGQAISEIASAGVEGGGFETAKALMKASAGSLKQINDMQKAIAKSAASAGKTTADAMYGAGIKAAEGLVKGLQKQQAKIVASMLNATLALEKAIKRALGKKGAGGIVGAAGGGPRSRRTLVGEYGPEIADLPAGTMVHSNPDSRRIAAGMSGGGGGRPIEVIIQLDGKTVARQIVNPLRAEIWHRSGGDVQKALGR